MEILEHLSFTPKETDIYKIHQSGDLANLDGLDDASLKALPSLKRLRDGLYSHEFRQFLCNVTGSASVSGKKTDMAINVYTPSCHLLCHDDVIGSRRISYILYLTDPESPWKPEWGGALRLYPTEVLRDKVGTESVVPMPDHCKSIPPAFNQLSFFAVQPGLSFHDVEEVYPAQHSSSTQGEKARVRMAISGWYHVPQEGEEGFDELESEDAAKNSSLAQLEGRSHIHDRPQTHPSPYVQDEASEDLISQTEPDLSEEDLDFLLQYIAPTYLTPDALEEVSDTFRDECSIVLDKFLSSKFSDRLHEYIQTEEAKPHETIDMDWIVARPPHKHRYLYQRDSSSDTASPLQELLKRLIPSLAFRKWFLLATGQILKSHDLLARRFRRGKDYTLAQSYELDDPRIEICLAITPSSGWETDDMSIENVKSSESTSEKPPDSDSRQAEHASVGGYLAYMAGEDDEAEYGGSDHGIEVPADMSTGGRATHAKKLKADPAVYQAQGDDEDGVLFSMPAGWNKLGIVLRDKGTMRFVKYVSQGAKGDRWDIFGEFEIENSDDSEEFQDEGQDEESGVEQGFPQASTDSDNAEDHSEPTDTEDDG